MGDLNHRSRLRLRHVQGGCEGQVWRAGVTGVCVGVCVRACVRECVRACVGVVRASG